MAKNLFFCLSNVKSKYGDQNLMGQINRLADLHAVDPAPAQPQATGFIKWQKWFTKTGPIITISLTGQMHSCPYYC